MAHGEDSGALLRRRKHEQVLGFSGLLRKSVDAAAACPPRKGVWPDDVRTGRAMDAASDGYFPATTPDHRAGRVDLTGAPRRSGRSHKEAPPDWARLTTPFAEWSRARRRSPRREVIEVPAGDVRSGLEVSRRRKSSHCACPIELLPWEWLIVGGTFLVLRNQSCEHRSASQIALAAIHGAATAACLLIGDPNRDDHAPLPGASRNRDRRRHRSRAEIEPTVLVDRRQL